MWAIELAETPEQSAGGGWVATIEGVAVVELDDRPEGPFRVRLPVEHGLAPSHADVVVELALDEKRALGGVPERVAASSACECFIVDEPVARVVDATVERVLRPSGDRSDRLVIGAMQTECVGEFTPDEELI
jgi:hypothetical protein